MTQETTESLFSLERLKKLWKTGVSTGRILERADIQYNGATPAISDEFDKALNFCYALVAPGQDANAIITANPERAAQAHRALYNRKPRLTDYDTMMARMKTLDEKSQHL